MLFTVLIWILMLLVYISGRNNKTNLWCVVAGIFFSFGTLKEYVFYDLPAVLAAHPRFLPPDAFFTVSYMVMTALLYFLTMPFAVIFAMYFNGLPTRRPTLFRWLFPALFLPAAVLALVFSPVRINEFQHTSHVFWYAFAAYNILYGVFMAILMIGAVLAEPSPIPRRQKRLATLILLPPVWFWLISIFVFHSLNITPLLKVWRDNQYLLLAAVVFYVIAAFREGMMGIRLRQEHYQWDSDLKVAARGTQYTSHILKNELTKIQWSVNNLQNRFDGDSPEELAIIDRASQHLKGFVEKTRLYANDILVTPQPCAVKELIESAVQSMREDVRFDISCAVECPHEAILFCDKQHVSETLRNLLANAADAMNGIGSIEITFSHTQKRLYDVLSVRDYGKGIAKQQQSRIYDPYYTTKKTNTHFGLGLVYCANVMKKHGGYIDVVSEEGAGSVFSLCFPKRSLKGRYSDADA